MNAQTIPTLASIERARGRLAKWSARAAGFLRWSLVLVGGLSLWACDRPAELPALSDEAVILAFGDSLTRGTGAGPGAGYPEVLAALTGREVVNAGVPGEESGAGLGRLPVVLDEVDPDLVILAHGGNDILRRRDLERTRANLRAMIELARERGVAVALLGIPKPGLFIAAHPLYQELAVALDVPLEDEALAEILVESDLKADQVHPNAAGYRRLAEAVRDFLAAHGAL